MAVVSIILNGDERQVRKGSIADLVAALGLDVKKVAVERNREIVPRSTLADVAIAEGDALEIVHFVGRSEEHTSELQSLMRISYAGFCLKKKKKQQNQEVRHN